MHEEPMLKNELYKLTFFDRSLQIPNYEHMEQDLKGSRSHEYLVAVTLDDLRKINNIFGTACGDALLRAVRDYILEMEIPNGTLYRGRLNDFGVLLKNTGRNGDIPCRVAEEIHDRCKNAWEISIEERRQKIFTSARVCVLPLDSYHEHFFSYLYSALEQSLDIARRTESVVVYDDETRERFDAGLKLELNLKNDVRENMRGFYVIYQPIVDMRFAIWKGVEALCRWDSAEFGSVPPSVFIPVAEANGLIGAIGLWVLEQSVIQIKRCGLDRNEGFLLEVNLSPVQLTTPNLDQIIIDLLRKHDYPPQKLGLEVTESSELNFSKHTMKVIERLSELGVVIILDDFGTGYSSFNSMHKLPAKVLKTDKTFITGMESDNQLKKLFCIMISLAHDSDMKLVAEGVESSMQVQFLLKQGADFFQGYFFSHPLTAEQLEEKLDNFNTPLGSLAAMGCPKWGLSGMAERLIKRVRRHLW